jgi:short-subunit dehydrogenase
MTRRDQFYALRETARRRKAATKQYGETVASTGVQARLVPFDLERASEIATLITSCEMLRGECDRLFLRITALLNAEYQG